MGYFNNCLLCGTDISYTHSVVIDGSDVKSLSETRFFTRLPKICRSEMQFRSLIKEAMPHFN